MKVSELLVRFLGILGTSHVFGIPGAHILPVYDSLYDSDIVPVLTKHEQGAAFMAGGYAKAGRRVGVCLATAGPGATNLVTGLAHAYVDRIPVLAITGETPTYSFGKGALQESSGEGHSIDQKSIFKGVTAFHRIVERPDYVAQVLDKTLNVLISPLPGPVLLSFPFNVLKEEIPEGPLVLEWLKGHTPDPVTLMNGSTVEEMGQLLMEARCPVIVAGWGAVASGASGVVRNLAQKLGIPVATSLKARGVMPESDPLSLGVLGVTSREFARRYIEDQADVVCLVGVSFGERTSYNWNSELLRGKRIIRVDVSPAALHKGVAPTLPVQGDARRIFEKVIEVTHKGYSAPHRHPELSNYRQQFDSPKFDDEGFTLVRELLSGLTEKVGEEALIFDDNIVYMQNFVPVNIPDRYFPNSGISSLGQSIPAAIGARISSGRPTVAVLGDGGFQMCCMELMTAVNHQIPLTVILLNNASLGLVRKNQHYNYRERYISCDFQNPDFELLARSFGIEYVRVASADHIPAALRQIDSDNILLVDVILNPDAFPNYSSGR